MGEKTSSPFDWQDAEVHEYLSLMRQCSKRLADFESEHGTNAAFAVVYSMPFEREVENIGFYIWRQATKGY